MLWSIFLFGLMPLIIFVIVDAFVDIRWATLGAGAASLIELVYSYRVTGEWDPLSVTACVLILLLGLATLRFQSPLYIKFQPVVLAVIVASIFSYLFFKSDGILVTYLPAVEQVLPSDFKAYLADDRLSTLFQSVFGSMIVVILLDAAWVAYAALHCSNMTWLMVNAFGLWILTATMLLLQLTYWFLF